MLSVSLLGDFRIRRDGTPVVGVDTPRLQSLLAYLLLHRDSPQSRPHLAFLFWPDTTEAQARTNLRSLWHNLRHALPDANAYLDSSVQMVQWRAGAPLALDVADFQAALADAEGATRAGNAAATRDALERAVTLYGGDLLPSCYDDWILPYREALRQAYLDALGKLARMAEDQGDYPDAIGHAQRLLRHDPLHEATYRDLMRLYALNGDRASALRVYHTCATVLQRELEVEPGPATREAYRQLLGVEAAVSLAIAGTAAVSPLVGREREWRVMLHTWRAAAGGRGPHLLVLCGEAGIGKTRLAEELVGWAARQGIACAQARCYAAEGQLAYAPVIAWLRARPPAALEDAWLTEVARLLPEVLARRPDLPPPGPLAEAWQRERLFEALARAILGAGQPLLLAADDLQWCDRDSLEWLRFLLRFDPGARLLVAGTYRPEEVGEGHPLLSLLAALRPAGQATELELGPLDEDAARALASHVAGREIDAATAHLLYRETEGNPLFVVETVRAGVPVGRGEPEAGAAGRSLDDALRAGAGLPPRVRAVLRARLAQLSPAARDLAEVAATIGREFEIDLLAQAGAREEGPLVRELDELWRRRIVREHGAGAYDFSHDKLREVAYLGQSAARRRMRHRAAARALEALHAGALDPVAHQVAAHYERAGLPAQAVPFYLRAAEGARRVYANEEAVALFRRGLALLDAAGAGVGGAGAGDVLAARLWEGLGDVLELAAGHEGALEAYRNAQGRLPRADRVGQARLRRKEGAVLREQRLYAEALDACRRAEAALGEPPGEESAWWAEWIEVQVDRVWAHYWLAQWPEMEKLVSQVQPVLHRSGSAASRSRFLMARCIMQLRKYRYDISDEMLAGQLEALAAGRESGDLKVLTDCEFEVGFLHLWRHELDEAGEHLQAALDLAQTRGLAWMRTLALTYLTVVCRFRGDPDGVRERAWRAREAAEAAHMPEYVAAALGNGAWLAWRRGDMAEVERLGREALEIWRQSPLVYPFQWLALWPLLGAAVARGDLDGAWAHVRVLLEPTQQRLPDALNAALESALRDRVEGRAADGRAGLDRAVALARTLGYL